MRRMPLSTAVTDASNCSLTACRISLRIASFWLVLHTIDVYKRQAKPSALYFKVGKACGQVPLPDVLHPDEPGAAHRLGKAVALGGIRGGAAVVRAVLAQILTADRLVAALALGATEPAADVYKRQYIIYYSKIL